MKYKPTSNNSLFLFSNLRSNSFSSSEKASLGVTYSITYQINALHVYLVFLVLIYFVHSIIQTFQCTYHKLVQTLGKLGLYPINLNFKTHYYTSDNSFENSFPFCAYRSYRIKSKN